MLTGGVVGFTFSCVIYEQYRRLVHGDRFFFSHANGDANFDNDQV